MTPTPRVPAELARLFGRRPKLLVVDDQAANVQALYQAFADDHQVFMATSGEQALEVCRAKQPDLVLLDIVMPGMDGHEVCAALKADPATCDTPVIFVTAHHDDAAEAKGLDLGAVDFISKPINPRIVRARVRTHLMLKGQSDLLRQWAYLDGLTQVGNRRSFDERLSAEWGRACRQKSPLSVVMLDVDFFKRYNDHHGHQAGDDCLFRVASALRDGLRRPTDLLARYGGEEFVALLPDTDAHGALAVATELGRRVRALAIPHAASEVGPVVTVSGGVATWEAASGDDAAALLRAADAQLYAAKLQGRDRVMAQARAAQPVG
ncbi:MAG: diguanylate cyclase [Rubrivivax sp.]